MSEPDFDQFSEAFATIDRIADADDENERALQVAYAQARCACAIVDAIDRLTAAVEANTEAQLTSPRAIRAKEYAALNG
jgi:hypothetical protein